MLTKEEQKELEELEKLEKSGALELKSGLSKEEEKELAYLEELEKKGELNLPEGPVDERTDEAALEGLGQGLSFGYLPQLQAKLEPVTDRVFNAITGNDVKPADWEQLTTNNEEYLKSRDANIKRNNELREKNPFTYGASEVAGNLISAVAASSVLPAPAVTAKGKAAQAALIGAGYGLINNPGDVEGVVDELQVGPRLKNAVVGTIMGVGFQVGIDKIAKYSKPLAAKLKKVAQDRAARKQAALEMELPASSKAKFRISNPDTGTEMLNTLKNNLDDVRITPKVRETNKKYAELGLEELSPVQMQKKATGEPTPLQYVESLAKSRDPKLYDKQLRQFDSLQTKLDEFAEMGSKNSETFGAAINEGLDEGLKKAGKVIGDFKDSIRFKSVDKSKLLKDSKLAKLDVSKFESADVGKLQGYMKRLFNSKNAQEIDDVLGLIGAEERRAFMQSGSGTPYTRALNKIKKGGEKYIEELVPDGKPREAYRAYAKVKNLYKDTLKGTLKTGGDAKVLKNITKSGANYEQFKEVAETLGRKDLVTEVKVNYVSDIFNQTNWRSALRKSMKTEVYEKILTSKEKEIFKTLLKYDSQMSSTMTKTTNPSKTGIMNTVFKVANNPAKAIEVVFGDERRMSRAVRRYSELIKEEVQGLDPSKSRLTKFANMLQGVDDFANIRAENPTAFQAILQLFAGGEKSIERLSKNDFKGQNLWGAKGIKVISEEYPEINLENPEVQKKLIHSKKGEALLRKAARMKKNKRGMASLKKEIQDYLKEGEK